eukprot:1100774-Prorocentrum_minimum.AAC.1
MRRTPVQTPICVVDPVLASTSTPNVGVPNTVYAYIKGLRLAGGCGIFLLRGCDWLRMSGYPGGVRCWTCATTTSRARPRASWRRPSSAGPRTPPTNGRPSTACARPGSRSRTY